MPAWVTPRLLLALAVIAVAALVVGLVLRFTTDADIQVLSSLRLIALGGGLVTPWAVGGLTRDGRMSETTASTRVLSGLAAVTLFGAAT